MDEFYSDESYGLIKVEAKNPFKKVVKTEPLW